MSQVLRLRNVGESSYDEINDDNPLPTKPISPALPARWQAIDFEQVTVANAIIGLTAAKVINAVAIGGAWGCRANCRLQTAEIRFLYDPTGTVVSTTVGIPLEALDTVYVEGSAAMTNFRSIRTGGTSGVLNVTYEVLVAA